ncbi:hypothetical protein V5P93_007021 [Actinokineospora auranticolor]|nr:hypothetical protein [Actinokineospora auranticolor]
MSRLTVPRSTTVVETRLRRAGSPALDAFRSALERLVDATYTEHLRR